MPHYLVQSSFNPMVTIQSNLIRQSWLVALLALVSFSQSSTAATISWGTGVGSIMIQSNGTPFDTSFKFEMGYFGNSFVPTASNLDHWSSNWNAWDMASAGDGYAHGIGYVSSGDDFEFDGTSTASVVSAYGQSFNIPTGSQAYLWIYNDKAYQQGSEWALLSNTNTDAIPGSWTFPSTSNPFPEFLQWRVGVEGDPGDVGTVVLGQVAHYEGQNDPDNYDIQTAAVPEAGTGLLAMAALLPLLKRDRRRKHFLG